MSLIQRQICTQLYLVGTTDSVLIGEVSFIQSALYREVSLIQRKICTQLYVIGTANSALIREVSLIHSALYRQVPLLVLTADPRCDILTLVIVLHIYV